jgi:lipid II:glycine glycyltransferase (peptidoglycan interpeptide bridge formation enzyme)
MNPLRDSRWERLVERHPDASVFHSTGWLEALRKTYDYEPTVFTTNAPGEELTNGIVFCRVRSWLTGKRLVSVPFSDHCQPLLDTSETFNIVISSLERSFKRERWKYVELRPRCSDNLARGDAAKSESFLLHVLDLRPDLDTLFRSFHKSCVQRKIHRAEREQLSYEEGFSAHLLNKFYHLQILTRRRHGFPPQPRAWFRNLIQCLGQKVSIRVASKDGQPVASILTFFHKTSLVYKYGCSDARFHNLGGTLLVFWKAIQDGKRLGALEYDLGRSELDNPGLVTFKENWGARSFPLTYYRYPAGEPLSIHSDWKTRIMKQSCSWMPDAFLTTTGRLLYRHIG